MRRKVFLGQNDIRFFYFRFKDSPFYSLTVIIFTILVSLILIFQIILPQLNVWFSIRAEVIATRERISTIRNNINFINNLDKGILDSQFRSAVSALPGNRSFSTIINALSSASIASGVGLNDFNFQVGEIKTDENSPDKVILASNQEAVDIVVTISGSLDQEKKFLEELSQRLPLSSVTSIDGNVDSLTVKIQFYYKDLPEIALSEAEPLAPVSDGEKEFLQRLSGWNQSAPDLGITPSGSVSAVPLFGESE